MIKWFMNLFKTKEVKPLPVNNTPKPMKAWAYRYCANPWTKVISPERPESNFGEKVIGPFRSEIDCEEFCDHNNAGLFGKINYVKH